MTAILGAFFGNVWAKFGPYILIALAVLAVLVGARKSGERIGEMKVRLDNAKAVEKARKKMDAVPLPDRSDVVDKLRNNKF